MQEILNDLNAAFKAISTIAVSGEAVDAIALARAKLRNVYAEIQKLDLNEDSNCEEDPVKMEN